MMGTRRIQDRDGRDLRVGRNCRDWRRWDGRLGEQRVAQGELAFPVSDGRHQDVAIGKEVVRFLGRPVVRDVIGRVQHLIPCAEGKVRLKSGRVTTGADETARRGGN